MDLVPVQIPQYIPSIYSVLLKIDFVLERNIHRIITCSRDLHATLVPFHQTGHMKPCYVIADHKIESD